MLSKRTSRSAAEETPMPSAAAVRRRATSAPAGTPSDRATVRCARNGRSSERPAGRNQLAVHRPGERAELRGAVGHGQPQRPWPARIGERPAAVDPHLERVLRRRDASYRLGNNRDAGFGRRTEEAQREMQAVHAHPADVTFVGGHQGALRPDPLHERGDRRHRRSVEGHRHEQAALGQRLRFSTSRSHVSRSARRISRARS